MEKKYFVGYDRFGPFICFDDIKDFKEEADDYGYIHITFTDKDGDYHYVGNEGHFDEVDGKAPSICNYKTGCRRTAKAHGWLDSRCKEVKPDEYKRRLFVFGDEEEEEPDDEDIFGEEDDGGWSKDLEGVSDPDELRKRQGIPEAYDGVDDVMVAEGFTNEQRRRYFELSKKLNLNNYTEISEFAKRNGCKTDEEILDAMEKEVSKLDNKPFYVEYLLNKGLSNTDIDTLVKDYNIFTPNEQPYDIDDLELAETIRMLALDELQKYIGYLKEESLKEFSRATFNKYVQLAKIVGKLVGDKIKEDLETDTEETVEIENEQPQTFEEKMDFLAADEQEAIDGYKKIIETIDDDFVKEQLNKIMIEEEAHKAYLEKVKEDKTIEYTEPLETEEDNEEEKETEEE